MDFFNMHYQDPNHWVQFDTLRTLYNVNFRYLCIESDESVVKTTNRDIRNYFLHKSGVVCNRIWKLVDGALLISPKQWQWLEQLESLTKLYTSQEYEWFILLNVYCMYLAEANLKLLIANFASFTELPNFYNLLNYSFKHVKLSTYRISILCDSECKELDDIIEDVQKRCKKPPCDMPTYEDIKSILFSIAYVGKSKIIDDLKTFCNLTLPSLYRYPPLVVNTIIALMSNQVELKTKTTFFADMIKICHKFNRNAVSVVPLVEITKKRKVTRSVSDGESISGDQ